MSGVEKGRVGRLRRLPQAALVAALFAATPALARPLKVVSFNIWGLPSPMLRHAERFKRIPEAVNRLDADVVLIQEAFNKESRALTRLSSFPYYAWGPRSRFLRFSSGLLILSKYPITVTDTLAYSRCGGFDCFANKGAQFARIQVPGTDGVNVFNTHLNANGHDAERASQARQLMDFVKARALGLPTVVGGDFNGEGKPLLQRIREALFMRDARAEFAARDPLASRLDLDGYTADPKRNPFLDASETQRRLDHIFFWDGAGGARHWSVLGYALVLDGRGGAPVLSDHFGVRAVAELEDTQAPRTAGGMPGIAAPAGPGRIRAQEIVGAVSAERTAGSEVKLQKPPAADPGGSASATRLGSITLPFRLEVTAGADGLFAFSDVAKQAAFFAEARFRVSRMMQLGGSAAVRYQADNQGASEVAAQTLFGPTFNFMGADQDLQDAFFVSPKAGITVGRSTLNGVVSGTSAAFTLALSAGKRFALSRNIAYAPSAGVVKEFGGSLGFVVQPLALSIFF